MRNEDMVKGKYKRYKNRLEMYLASGKGKRVLNFMYSWGASIVILGALFKLLHLPYANQILFVAMVVESIVFFISAFERPGKDYHWEDVFPVLKSKNPMGRPDFGGIIQGGGRLNIFGNQDLSEEDTKNLSDGIQKLNGATEQLSKLAELTETTKKYLEQLSGMSGYMEDINLNSQGYVEHMERLNHSIAGLSTMYEMQLKSFGSQFEVIQRINSGLNRICEMYEGSVVDSTVFRRETDQMTRQLAELNLVYGRMLQAMTVNMGYQSSQPPVYQQSYGNPSHSPYTNNPVE